MPLLIAVRNPGMTDRLAGGPCSLGRCTAGCASDRFIGFRVIYIKVWGLGSRVGLLFGFIRVQGLGFRMYV